MYVCTIAQANEAYAIPPYAHLYLYGSDSVVSQVHTTYYTAYIHTTVDNQWNLII